MELKEVKTLTCIKEGDTIIITGDQYKAQLFKVQKVKVSKTNGTEIIIDKKMNNFNLKMYLDGLSWVKECKILVP